MIIINRRRKILIADDAELNRLILRDMLEDEYELLECSDGLEAVEMLREHRSEISLLLLDVMMPRLDGFAVLEEMNRRGWIRDIQVIIISAETSPANLRRAYDLGAVDYISRPFDSFVVHRRIVNTILLFRKQEDLKELVAAEVQEREKNGSLMVAILSNIVEFRNGESGRHVQHINIITKLLLQELFRRTDRYDDIKKDLNTICTASSLHDIGKINIPSEILNKPGKLTTEEFEVIKTHTLVGSDMMAQLTPYSNEPLVRYSSQICRWHHERWDGRGYPDGLSGDDIPISAQVVSIADVYDALTSERCYKLAYSHEKSMEMILNNESGVFNPLLLECLVSIGSELKRRLLGEIDLPENKMARSLLQELENRGMKKEED